MSTLLIRILERNKTSSGDVRAALENVNYPLQWVLIRNDQSLEQGEATASTFSEQLKELVEKESNLDSIAAVIPSEQVLMLSCSVPGRNSGQIRKALPYALEEYVAADIETMHIAVGPIKSGQRMSKSAYGSRG
jgi:type II secretory pathway component PulL